MISNAPIAVFIYARPDHLRCTLLDLLNCDGFERSRIFVFADGPKTPEQIPHVEAARAVAKDLLGGRANYIFSDQNKGLARSIIDGVTELTEIYGRVIVVEDDLGLAPQFLTFMNSALNRYENTENVYQVSGHLFDVRELNSSKSVVFLPFTTTWGWATWRRAWRHFDPASAGWQQLTADPTLRSRFNLDGVYDYAGMLERQMLGLADSWGIRWYWSVFMRSGLTVYPPRTLVNNRGMDGSGSHGRGFVRDYRGRAVEYFKAPSLPDPQIDPYAFKAVKAAIYRQNGGLIGRVVDLLKRFAR